jgi:signal transduction histidine kinase
MVVNNPLLARARPWLLANRNDMLRALAIPFSLGLTWWLVELALPSFVWLELVVYGLIQLLLSFVIRRRPALANPALWASLAADAMFAALLVAHAAILGGAIYPFYFILALRAIAINQCVPLAMIIPFVLGPTYLFSESLSRQLQPVSTSTLSAQWTLMFGSLGFGVIAILSSTIQQLTKDILREELRGAQLAAESRVAQLEENGRHLRAKMRERKALEEVLRVITSTLSLDEVLSQIVDSTMEILRPERVHGIALSLETDGAFTHHAYTYNGVPSHRWATPLARRAMSLRTNLIVGDIASDPELTDVMTPALRSALSVPLFIGAGGPRGALTVVSTTKDAFSSSDADHMGTFALQAGIAIGNAELHSRMERQQGLIEAVLRDISDGLIVTDASGNVVLTNPVGAALLHDTTSGTPVREQVRVLAESILFAEHSLLTTEIRVGRADETNERVFQAIGSLVREQKSEGVLVAIVLHDITAQKAEEHSRSQFISMVAHELRNPLNSLNGFVKIVLQGRAGSLTPLQQEFLQIADSQVEQLKGRISELLEYNRLDAGKLVLKPEWNHLPLLVTGTVTRLQLQAEQAGLTLINEVDEHLPECQFDSERIGQVLTNLIENGIKATPPSGIIRVRSQLHEDEIWLRVCDTGVGIPADEQRKIFEPFVQGSNGSTRRGGNLGLGLAICKQIVEGHQGRLWVESEPGQGSCFTVALPLAMHEVEFAA